MVMYKAKYYKKSSKSRKTSTKRSKNPGAQALKIVKSFTARFKPELKIAEDAGFINSQSILNTGSVALLTFIDQGEQFNERIGNVAILKSIIMKGYVHWNSAGANGQVAKMWIIHDKQQQNSLNPAFSDIMNGQNIVSFLETDNNGRFSVLGEYTFVQDTSKQLLPFTIAKPFTKHQLRWAGSSGANTQKGHIYLLFCSNRANVANPPTLYLDRQVRFYDP